MSDTLKRSVLVKNCDGEWIPFHDVLSYEVVSQGSLVIDGNDKVRVVFAPGAWRQFIVSGEGDL